MTTSPKMDDRLTREQAIREAVARGWCDPANSHKEMDTILAESIAREILALRQDSSGGVPCEDCGFPMARGETDRSGQEWWCPVCAKAGVRLAENKRLKAELAALAAPQAASLIERLAPREHTAVDEKDTKLLRAFTPDKRMAPGFEIEFWNLTMVRKKGDVVLTVRLPSTFSHYVKINEENIAAWHPGVVSSVRFPRDLWKSFVEQIADADKVFRACDELDGTM